MTLSNTKNSLHLYNTYSKNTDLNIDYLKCTKEKQLLYDIFGSYDLQNVNQDPTRVFTNVNGVTLSSKNWLHGNKLTN